MLGQHVRPGHQAVNQERAEQDRHAGARRHAEGDGRDQRAALAGIGRAFGGDDAAHVAGAESLARAFLGAQRMAVGDPVDHRGADAGNGAHRRAEPRAAQDQEPMLHAVLHAEQHAALGVERHAFLDDRRAADGEIAQLRQRENAERQRHQRQAVPQIQRVHGPAQRARLRIGADHRQHHAEAGGGQPAQRRIAGQHRDHGNAEHGDAEKLGRADVENDRAQDRQRDRHQRRAEQSADQRRHIGGAERAAGLAAPGHRIAVERRRRGSRMARRAEQDRGNRIGRRGRRAEPEQQRERGRRIEIVGERQQQRRAGDAADARQDAERQPHAHAGEQIEHAWGSRMMNRASLRNAACPFPLTLLAGGMVTITRLPHTLPSNARLEEPHCPHADRGDVSGLFRRRPARRGAAARSPPRPT